MKTDDKNCRTCVRNGAKSCKGRTACNCKRMTDSDPHAKPTKPKRFTKKQIADVDGLLRKWYALGWSVNPKCIRPVDVFRILTLLGTLAEASWNHAVRTGRAPAEDISPAEGFNLLAFAVLEAARRGKVRSFDPRKLVDRHHRATAKSRKDAVHQVVKMVDRVVPGYFTEGD